MEDKMEFVVILGAFLPAFLVLAVLTLILSFLNSPRFKGFAGEILVHISAKIHLNRDKYHILRNVMLPTPDGTTQIDHVIVSEYGVFVVETKNMKGWIFGGAHQRMWTQKIFKYTKKFQNPLHQNYKHVETLKSILELNDQQIFSVVVFVGSSTFKIEMPENVINGPGLIRFIKSKNEQVILNADVQLIISKIEAERLMPSKETTKSHIDYVKQIVEEKQNGKLCPQCGGPIVTRKVRKGVNSNEKFIGCSRYPECRGTAFIAVESECMIQKIMEEQEFTDSWGNRTWRDDEIQPAFTDRAFR